MQQLGSTQNDKPIGLAVSSTSEIVIAGSTPSQWFLAKYNSGGTLQWQRTFTTAAPGAIALASGGQIVAVTAAGDYLEQYSSTGTLVWRQQITEAEFAAACCLVIDRSGNIIVGGSYVPLVSGNVAKFGSSGSLMWRDDFGGPESGSCTGLTTDASGNVIAVGPADVTNADGAFDHFDVMAKWSPDGTSPGVVALPLNRLNFWLATIHPNKVPDPDTRAKVIRYQIECADALFAHFFGKAAPAITEDRIREIVALQISDLLRDRRVLQAIGYTCVPPTQKCAG